MRTTESAGIATQRPASAKPRRPWRRRLRRLAAGAAGLLVAAAVAFAVAWHAFPFPVERLDRPASPVVRDRAGRTLLRLVGPDDQWRLPVPLDQMSPWLRQATVAVEDERFYGHRGVDPLAVLRAAGQNARAGRTVSGASTLTMQVCRMLDDRPRTWRAKATEAFRALQLDRLRSKDEILASYLNLAPYGRNLRGAEAASLAYFGKHAIDLSLDEAALLAGLPQSPSRYRPDRFPEAARARRATVLRRMEELGLITAAQRAAAAAEPIRVVAAPTLAVALDEPAGAARHAAWLALSRRSGGGATTLDAALQEQVTRLARERAADPLHPLPPDAQVGVVVIDIATGEIRALLGSLDPADPRGGQVAAPLAWRSPGSALKPFVYAAAFEARRLAPESPVYDVPIRRAGWAPENFDRHFRGTRPAAEALSESLNVPAILVAEAVGLPHCTGLIRAAGVALPEDADRRGGLALVTGAVEVRLLDLTNAYATIGRGGVRRPARLFADEPSGSARALDANVCATLDAILSSRQRRPRAMEGLAEDQVPWFTWKTGTSSGRRDAWAVGHNGRFAIGVWVGRFSGAGHAAFVGSEAAEPLLARLFALPQLRSDRPTPPPRAWVVVRPIEPPREVAGPLRILVPQDGATFVALGGASVVHPRANRPGELTWFLDGALLPPGEAERLALPPGRHELRCVCAEGEADGVAFVVR